MSEHEQGKQDPQTSTSDGAQATTTVAPAQPAGLAQAVQRRAIQRRAVQRRGAGPMPSARAEDAAPTGAGQPLPGPTQAKMERSFGTDFSDVRVHEGPQAEKMGATAFTQGTDVHFQPGGFAPGSASGDSLIGHELAHVVQQRSGRVSAPQGKDAPIVEDQGLETEADVAGERAARGEPAVVAGGGGHAGGAVQRKADPIQRVGAQNPTPNAQGPQGQQGHDSLGLGGFLRRLQAETGVSGEAGKFAEAKVGIKSPPIPQLGGAAVEGEIEGRYMTRGEGAEIEASLKLGLNWGVDFKLFKADVKVFGEGKIKLAAKGNEMLECLTAAAKGVMWDGIRQTNLANLTSVVSPLAAAVIRWGIGREKWAQMQGWNLYSVLEYLAAYQGRLMPASVKQHLQSLLGTIRSFFGAHHGSYEVSAAIGVGASVGGGPDGQGLQGSGQAKVVHGISSGDGERVMDQTSRNEVSVEGSLKRGDTEGKVGYVFGGGRNVLTVEGSMLLDDHFDFEKAKILSLGGILKLFSAAGLGRSIGNATQAPNGTALVNALVSGLASGAAAVSGSHLPGLKKSFKLSLEAEREGDTPWVDSKLNAKVFLGRSVGGKGGAGRLGEVEARVTAGTFVDITREAKTTIGQAGGGHQGG